MMLNFEIGKAGEKQASEFLKKNGLKLIATRFRSRFGEIDLIMEDKNELVFIEVKFRNKLAYGQGLELVNKRKQTKLIKTALFFLQRKRIFEKKPCRFDVVDIHQDKIQWIKDAFQL